MKNPQNYILKKTAKRFVSIAVLLSVFLVTTSPALGEESGGDFLIPGNGYTVDYYRSYGEPALEASIIGNPEFQRGEIADIQIILANKGVIEGMKRQYVNQSLIPDSKEEMIAVAEMGAEQDCTIARGIKANLVSGSDQIHVEPTTTPQTINELKTGNVQPIKFTIRIDDNATAGDYGLKLPVTYEYQRNVRTDTPNIINLGLSSDTNSFTKEYSTQEVTLPLHISIKNEPKFEITNISGSLKQGSTGLINVTYTNRGETTAEDAQAKIVVMQPLSTSKSTANLGTIKPGESQTASFEISAGSGAVVKNYSIDSEVRYTDVENDGKTRFSENMKVYMPIEKSKSKISMTVIVGVLLAVVLIYQGIKVLRSRKRYNKEEQEPELPGDDYD